jgi:hypothetical protein
LRLRGRNIGKVGFSELSLGFAKLSGDAKLLEAQIEEPVSEPPGGRQRSSDRNRPLVEPAPARAPDDDIATDRFRPARSFEDIRR